MKKNILLENLRRFGAKNLPKNIITESNLSDDDILDIILTYTKDPDKAEEQLSAYRETGKFSDNALESNVTRDPRWTQADSATTPNVRNRWETEDEAMLLKVLDIEEFDAGASWNRDYSDWSDIYATQASWGDTGEELTDEEIEILNDTHSDEVAERYHAR
jgi:hypothetical protein